jgi:hypothetical protein
MEESKHRTAQEGEPTPSLWGVSTDCTSPILRGHIPAKGNEFTLRDQNHCIPSISQGSCCYSQ